MKIGERFKSDEDRWLSAGNKNTVLSVDFGFTTKVKFDFKRMFTFIRYNRGIMDLTDRSISSISNDLVVDVQRNYNLQVGLGYKLNIK